MPVKITEYLRPGSLKEALALLAEDPARNIAVGGGISIVLSGAPRHVRAIDLQRVGLDAIEKTKDELRLGATATLDDIVRSQAAADLAMGVLPNALRTAASEPIRRMITVAGNIVQCYYWATLPPVLLALDAKIHLRSAKHRRTLSAAEFFAEPPMRVVQKGELLVDVTIPCKPERHAAFEKLAKTSNDYALIHTVVSYAEKRGKVSNARVVVAACTSLPVRVRAAEEFLEGRLLDLATAMEAGRIASAQVKLRGDYRASADYRRRVLAVMLQRALLKAAESKITN
jgi:carbon-monoxide dehydrogenase medium subunit/6-hydroxypseudooxynicotine dehydrogenase subunit alpha